MNMVRVNNFKANDLVEIPFAFLQGARQGGQVLSVECEDGNVPFRVTVGWPDGDITTEFVKDLAFPEPPRLSLRERLCRILTGSRLVEEG